MINRVLYDLARAKYRQDKKQLQGSKASPGGPWTPLAVVFTIVPLAAMWPFANLLLGTPVPVAAWIVPGLLTVLGVTGAVAAAAVRRQAKTGYDALYEQQRQGDPLQAPGHLAKVAAIMEELDEQQRVIASRGRGPLPEVSGDTREELTAVRDQRLADLYKVPCPVPECQAPAAVGCVLRPFGKEFIIVRTHPLAYAHAERVRDAVLTGAADADDVLAQFDKLGNVPENLLQVLQGARKEE